MSLKDEVAMLMRGVAATAVTPRFRMLAAHEIAEKGPGEIVTVADHEAESRLYDGLEAIGIPARIVGEEAVEQDPALLDDIGQGLVWLVDPLDGTANFAAGRRPFGMMVALVEDGVPLAGWILDPISGRLCHAERGVGATCDDVPVLTSPMRGDRPIAALGTHFLTAEIRERVERHAAQHFTLVPVPRCAAESYPRLALGQDDIVMFQRGLPWDHAAGALFLSEAGGVITDWSGALWRVGSGHGVLAAANERLWQAAADVLFDPATGLIQKEECSA